MNYFAKSILSLFLVGFGIINFYTAYELLGRKEHRFSPEVLRCIHRFSGYSFIAFFVFISILCLIGIVNNPFDFSPRGIIHTTIAITVLILLIIKFLVIKFYRGFFPEVPTLGKSIFILSLLLFAISSGYYFLLMYPKGLTGTLLVQNKCSRCHTLERVFSFSKSEEGWKETVTRMSERAPGWISPEERKQIINYLIKTRKV